MRNPKRITVFVIEQTESGKAIKCSLTQEMENTFYLPKSQIKPIGKVRKAEFHEFDVAEFIFLSHWQLCGREAFEKEKARRQAQQMG